MVPGRPVAWTPHSSSQNDVAGIKAFLDGGHTLVDSSTWEKYGAPTESARALLSLINMMTSSATMPSKTNTKNEALDAWLNAVSSHLAVRRTETTGATSRNRSRELARREARRLFAVYYRDLAKARVQAA